MQPLDPDAETMPAEQSTQLESPLLAAYLPAAQPVQLAAAPPEYWPAKQLKQLALDDALIVAE